MAAEKKVRVICANDGLSADIIVSPTEGESVEYKELMDELTNTGVKYGIMTDVLHEIIEYRRYNIEIRVAEGKAPTNGEDGYYEYLFDTNVEVKPKILADGSVDYKSMGEVPVVQEGQELVRYIPATSGNEGISVYGNPIFGKKGQELHVLSGKGFVLNESKTLYTAAVTGKATLKENWLDVTNVLVVDHDVTPATGGISFAGDVVIKGNVLTGAEVHANGNIEVNGCVEAVTIVAGKNVVLKNGMQGNGKGKIIAGGEVSGKFFEQVNIEAKGDVHANALMNCKVKCEENVQVSGRFGVIIGGNVHAYRQVEATTIGNLNEIKTSIEVGVKDDMQAKMRKLDEKQAELQKELEKIKSANEKVLEMLKQYPDNEQLKQNKMSIMRTKISKEAVYTENQKAREEMLKIIGKTVNPKIYVNKSIYAGSILTINGVTQIIKSENYNVNYYRNGIELSFQPNI